MKKHESIITDDWEHCILCGAPPSEEHHAVMGVANRKLADKYHLVVPLCHICHANLHDHGFRRRDLEILAQTKFEQCYPDESFLRIFGRNYKYE